MNLKAADRLGITLKHRIKRLGDCGGGNVVMGRADAAGGEDVVKPLAHLPDRIDDAGFDIGNDPAFGDRDTDPVQPGCQPGEIGILRATAQDFIADNDECRLDTLGHVSYPCYAVT